MALMVGAGRQVISPTADVFPFLSSISNGENDQSMIAYGVHDDIYCRAIIIENGTDSLLFVSWELPTIPAIPDLKRKLAERSGVPEKHIILSSTYNGTAFYDDAISDHSVLQKLHKIELEGVLTAINNALASKRNAKIGYGETVSYCNTNRNLETLGGQWVKAQDLGGYSDKTVAMIKFVDDKDKIIAVILNYGCRATCARRARDVDGLRKTSGNFSGIASRFIEEHFRDEMVALWTSGAAENQEPLLSRGMRYEYPDGTTGVVEFPDGVDYMLMEWLGRRHGADCVRGINGVCEYTGNVRIKSAGKRIKCSDKVDTIDMHVAVIGNIAAVCTNTELSAEVGREIKSASPLKNTFVITSIDNTAQLIAGHSVVQNELLVSTALDLFDVILEE